MTRMIEDDHRDPAERPSDRKVERSKKKFDKAWRWISVGIGILLFLVVYTIGFHAVTLNDTHNSSCDVLNKSIRVQTKFIEHLEKKSIENVEAGVTSATTSLVEIHKFFDPTLEEIKRTHC